MKEEQKKQGIEMKEEVEQTVVEDDTGNDTPVVEGEVSGEPEAEGENPVEQDDADEVEDRRGGDKTYALDEAAVASKDGDEEGGEDAAPSFFMETDERVRVEVDILSNKKTGAIKSVSRKGMGIDFSSFTHLRHQEVWFEFSQPTYEQLSMYRQRSSTYQRSVGQMLVDKIGLRNYLLVWHLKDWSVTGKDGQKVKLDFDEDGSLDEKSIRRVYSVQPVVMDVVLTVFEKEIMLG